MVRTPLHLVSPSPWPIMSGLTGFMLTMSLICLFHKISYGMLFFVSGLTLMIFVMFQWWRDITREATFLGSHTFLVIKGLKLGMILFIISEVMFFFGFFWAFFHSALSPTFQLGSTWPPMGVEAINPFSIPLLNTATLLASGVTVTLAHHSILSGKKMLATQSLFLTVFLGAYFTFLQAMEYKEASFSIADSVYGSTFFVATGFHGLHVLIGSTILLVTTIRLIFNQFSSNHHFGFEAAAWYWHFVDVVWIALYICLYWWGS